MIPILYKADATNFASYGIGALPDTMSCEVTEERNGAYECVVKYPVTGIWESTPITPQLAIEEVFDNALTPHRFTFQTDYTEAKAFAVSKPKSLRAVLGGEEGSVLSLWGGEFEWDNFKVIHHQGRGHNNGVVIEYGKNLTKFEHDSDISDVYTDLLPYAVTEDKEGNETVITLAEQILQIGKTTLSQRKTLIKDFTDSFDIDAVITEDLLREKAQKYLENNPLGMETPTLTISFEALWKQPEYAAVLERVALCDTVTVRHSELGISEHVKVIKTVYDTLAEKYVSITLGSAKASLLSTISDTAQSIDNIVQKVDRFPSLMQSAINSATKLITGQKGGYVVLHGDETGQPYELLVLDSPNIADAVNVWRWNVGGLGFSSNGYNGPYETAITSDGQIVADFITSGSLVANIIKAGVLSSVDGSSYWNLETGEVVLRAYATTETVEETNSRIDEIEEQKMLRLVITSTNGNIFKNGNIQTTLEATVYSWDENITDTLDENQFIWTRVSDDAAADAEWNQQHFGGSKSIEITKDDVKVRATFFCDLIDTTTRKSLLG